jgi:integrase
MTDLLDRFTVHLAAAGLHPDTIRIRRRHVLGVHALHPDLTAVSTSDLTAWLASHTWGLDTRRQARASLRLFYGFLVDEGVISRSPATRLPKVRPATPRVRPCPVPVFAAALERADDRGRRALLLERYAGLRRSEVARLHADDFIQLGDGTPAVIVRGKGDKMRTVPLHPFAAAACEGITGYLFPGRNRPHLHPDVLGRIVSSLLGPGWTGHTLRHRAGADFYSVAHDIRAVQQLLGHATVSITERYVMVQADAMTRAVLGVA